jgi:hypothetical protein
MGSLLKRMNRSESEFRFQPNAGKIESLQSLSTKQEENPHIKPEAHKVFIKPEVHLESLLKSQGYSTDSFQGANDLFLPITRDQDESYPQAALAARNEDLDAFKELHNRGLNLQSANRFGESIVHIVCRRGNDVILGFLTQEANVSVRVRDDLGRTPLHDAAWTERPNFALVRMVLLAAPDLLFVRDNRGHSALAYAPCHRWGEWCKFLEENMPLIEAAFEYNHFKAVG